MTTAKFFQVIVDVQRFHFERFDCEFSTMNVKIVLINEIFKLFFIGKSKILIGYRYKFY